MLYTTYQPVVMQPEPHRARLTTLLIKTVYVLIGLLLGACIGLYIAALTMPPPHENVIYMTGRQ